MCEHCDFDYPKMMAKPFKEGFGITAAIERDRYFYSIVNIDGRDGIIYGINYCPMCGRNLQEDR